MIQLILEFCQTVFRKYQEQFDSLVGRFGIADFPRLNGRKVILVRALRGRAFRRQAAHAQNHEQDERRKRKSSLHGFASPAGGTFSGSLLRRGNSRWIKASSVSIKSLRTISNGGRTSSGATSSVSSTSRIPCRTSNSSCLYPLECRSASGSCFFRSSNACRTLSRYFSKISPTAMKSP